MSTTPTIQYSGPAIDPKDKKRERDRQYYLNNRQKKLAQKAEWRKKNIEDQRAKRKLLYWSNPEKARAAAREWRASDPEKARAVSRESAARVKIAVIRAYGGHCACCGEAQVEFLTLDHVNNDGGKQRKNGALWGRPFYQQLKREGFPPRPDLQVLCYNCNCAKKGTGECPHQIEATKFVRKRLR